MTLYTPHGIPYPTASDLLAQTHVYINDLRTAATYRLENPRWVYGGGDVVPDGSGNFTITVPYFAHLRGGIVETIQTSDNQPEPISVFVRERGVDFIRFGAWYQKTAKLGYEPFPYYKTLPIEYLLWGDPK